MRKQVVLALGLTVLLLSAGCLNFTDSSGDFPDELTEDDLETHRTTLQESDGYEATVNITLSSDGSDAGVLNQTYRIDNADEQYYSRAETNLLGESTTEKFTNDSATWERSTSAFSDGFTYDYAEAPYEADNDTFVQPLQPVNVTQAERGFTTLGGEAVERSETTMYNGEEVGVYEADTEQVRTILNESSEDDLGAGEGSIDDGTLTLYLNSDGVLVYQNLNVTGTSEQGTDFAVEATYAVSDVNETDVTEPSWLETARNESTSDSGF